MENKYLYIYIGALLGLCIAALMYAAYEYELQNENILLRRENFSLKLFIRTLASGDKD